MIIHWSIQRAAKRVAHRLGSLGRFSWLWSATSATVTINYMTATFVAKTPSATFALTTPTATFTATAATATFVMTD